MKIFKNVKILSIILIAIFCLFKLKKINSLLLTNKFFIVSDSIFSNEINNQINEFINKNLVQKSLKEASKILMDKFSFINNIKIQKKNLTYSTIIINGDSPLYQINDGYIFSQSGKILSKDFFKNENINSLETITLNSDVKNLNSQTINFIEKIPASLTDEFKIFWENDNSIKLKSKNQNFTIITTNKYFPDNKISEICKKLYQEVLQNPDVKQNTEVITDLRFSNQIVVSLKGG